MAEDSLGDFWLWLTSLLFRPQQIEPTAERFQLDFGTWSPLYREGMAALKRAWAKVSAGSEAKLAFDTWQRYLTVTSAIARHLLPYAHLAPEPVVLPLDAKDGVLSVVTANKLIHEGYREFGKWMKEVERIWADRSGEKAGKQTVYEWLDYSGKLEAQHLHQRHLVLYNAAGTNVCAAYFDRDEHSTFVVDHKLYWAAFSSHQEAHYLSAILNSETVNAAIKPFQSVGLLGERDIHKKLLELPIPTYDHENAKHQKISELGAKAREEAVKAIRSGEFPVDSAIARQRGFMREHLKSELEEIDKLVAALLS